MASFRDVIFICAFFVITAILLVIFDTTYTTIRVSMLTVSQVSSNADAVHSLNTIRDTLRMMDVGLAFIFFMDLIISLILASRLPSSLMYYGFSLLGVILLAVIIPPFSNLYVEAITNPVLIAAANEYPLCLHIAQNLPTIGILFFLMTVLVVHSKGNNVGFDSGTGGAGLI